MLRIPIDVLVCNAANAGRALGSAPPQRAFDAENAPSDAPVDTGVDGVLISGARP